MNTLYYATTAFVAKYTSGTGYEIKDFQTGQWRNPQDPTIGRTIAQEGTQIPLSQVDRTHNILKRILCPLPANEVMKYIPPVRTLVVQSLKKPRL